MNARVETSLVIKHMLLTYRCLRYGMAAIAIAFPIVLVAIGSYLEDGWRGSLSAYYYLRFEPFPVPKENFEYYRLVHNYFATGEIFVGGLFAIGAMLYLYKGYSESENLALNVAGVSAILVALFPTNMKELPLAPQSWVDQFFLEYLHGISAVVFFLCLFYVAFRHGEDTLDELVDPPASGWGSRSWYARTYKSLAYAMLVLPLVALVLVFSLGRGNIGILVLEAFAIWGFAAYWVVKSFELNGSDCDYKRLARGQYLAAVKGDAIRQAPLPGAALS